MIKKILILIALCPFFLNAQSIDGSFDFQSDPAKKYSLYIPSNYNPDSAATTILAFHPFNTSRWDAIAWRDTLIEFSEMANAILIAPDGGIDGKVDDPIDTAFTSFLLDTISQLYNIDTNNTFLMGFSWGGRTAYTYGLHRPHKFSGSLISGAAVEGTDQVLDVLDNAELQEFYIIHGTNDVFNTRYTIIEQALNDNGACTESNILQNIGHTIDYPNRNMILLDGLNWLKDNACLTSNSDDPTPSKSQIHIFPNPNHGEFEIDLDISNEIKIYDLGGNLIPHTQLASKIRIADFKAGIYLVKIKSETGIEVKKVVLMH